MNYDKIDEQDPKISGIMPERRILQPLHRSGYHECVVVIPCHVISVYHECPIFVSCHVMSGYHEYLVVMLGNVWLF